VTLEVIMALSAPPVEPIRPTLVGHDEMHLDSILHIDHVLQFSGKSYFAILLVSWEL